MPKPDGVIEVLKSLWEKFFGRTDTSPVSPDYSMLPEAPPPPENCQTAEERHDWEIRYLKESYRQRVVKLSTTLLRLKHLASAQDSDDILSVVLEILEKGCPARNLYLLRKDADRSGLFPARLTGPFSREFRSKSIPLAEASIPAFLGRGGDPGSEQWADSGSVLGIHECQTEPRLKGLSGGTFPTTLAAPLYVDGKVYGVVGMEYPPDISYTRDDVVLLGTVVEIAGRALGVATRLERTEKKVSDITSSEQELRQALSRIVPPAVADRILASPQDLKPLFQPVVATLLLMDIRWAPVGDPAPPPQATCTQLNAILTLILPILRSLDGSVGFISPERIRVSFGAPIAVTNHAERGILAALKIKAALQELPGQRPNGSAPSEPAFPGASEAFPTAGKTAPTLAMVIDSGPGAAGYFGDAHVLSYDVFSHETATISRFFPSLNPNTVWITPRTKPLAEPFFSLEPGITITDPTSGDSLPFLAVKDLRPEITIEHLLGVPEVTEPTADGQISAGVAKQNLVIDVNLQSFTCPNCGQGNPNSAKFCEKCGMPVF